MHFLDLVNHDLSGWRVRLWYFVRQEARKELNADVLPGFFSNRQQLEQALRPYVGQLPTAWEGVEVECDLDSLTHDTVSLAIGEIYVLVRDDECDGALVDGHIGIALGGDIPGLAGQEVMLQSHIAAARVKLQTLETKPLQESRYS